MRSLRDILSVSDTRRGAALRVWRLTHAERGCNDTAIGGRCRCVCPDHRCIDIYEPETGDIQCWTCRDERVVRLEGLPRDDPRFGRAQPCPACLSPEDRQAAHVRRNAPSLALRPSADLRAVYPRDRQDALERWLGVLSPYLVTLWGPAGSGKSYAATAVGWQAASEMTVECITAVGLLDEIRACYAPGTQGEVEDVLRRLRSVGLLILDDLGAHRDSEHTGEKLLQVIDERSVRARPTIVTTNLSPEDMAEGRLRSRLFGTREALVLACGGKDRRNL